jgi:hypothetical protein
MFDLILSPAIGAIVGVLTAIWVENLRRPRLSLSVGDTPQDFPQPKGTPAQILRPARLKVTNDRGPRWMTRDPALQCRAEITFRHLDGQKVFAKSMDGRWSNSPEPTPIEVVGTLPDSTPHSHTVSIGSNQIRLQMLDPTRITLVSRIDIHAGEANNWMSPLDWITTANVMVGTTRPISTTGGMPIGNCQVADI